MNETEDGRKLKVMPIVNEYSRECLTKDAECTTIVEDVLSALASLFRQRGEPAFIRSENGPRSIAQAI